MYIDLTTHMYVDVSDSIIKWERVVIEILLISLISPHCCACLKPGPGFPSSIVIIIFFWFNDLRLEVVFILLISDILMELLAWPSLVKPSIYRPSLVKPSICRPSLVKRSIYSILFWHFCNNWQQYWIVPLFLLSLYLMYKSFIPLWFPAGGSTPQIVRTITLCGCELLVQKLVIKVHALVLNL